MLRPRPVPATVAGTPDPAHDREAGRARTLLAGTLVAGTAVLGGTLAVTSGTVPFYALGLLLAAIWVGGALLGGAVPWQGSATRGRLVTEIVIAIAIGAAVFGGFVVAKLVADHISFLANSVDDVLGRARRGTEATVLGIALVNGIGEEVFFRGALQSRLGTRRGVLWATVIYALVTVATLNAALVVAAAVLGLVLSWERHVTEGVLAPTLTHLTWSALIILFLPR